MSKLILIALCFLITVSSYGQEYFRLMSSKKIISKKRFATVMIDFLDGKKLIRSGAGFFLGKNGHIITNKHVLDPFISSSKKLKVVVGLYSKRRKASTFRIIHCSDERKIDLCLLKLTDFKPFEYFPIKKIDFENSPRKKGRLIAYCWK